MQKKMMLAIIVLIILCSTVSCSQEMTTLSTQSIANESTGNSELTLASENAALKAENDRLLLQVEQLQAELSSQNSQTPYLSPFNFSELSILQHINSTGGAVGVFYGYVKSLEQKRIGDTDYFIFTIDETTENPNWDGPGSDGDNGPFLNPDENPVEHSGNFYMTFEGYYYSSDQEKITDVTGGDCYSTFLNEHCIFYTVSGEIVYAAPSGP